MKTKITNGILMGLIINMVYPKAIGVTQGLMAREAMNDIWVAMVFSTIKGSVIMLLTVLIICRMPDKNLAEYASVLFGKWVGKFISLLQILFFLGAYATVMITFVYHMLDYFLPEMPVLLLIVVALIVGVYGVFHGLEVLGRTALVGVFAIISLNVLILIGSLHLMDVRELMPFLNTGVINTFIASRHNDTDWAVATMMTGMILPMVREKTIWSRAGVGGVMFSAIMVGMWPLLEVGVLSPEVTGHYTVSCMQLARSAEIGMFIHRYEMIMVAFFAITSLVQTMICILCTSQAASQLFGLKDIRPMIIPSALVLSAFGYWIVLDKVRAVELLEHVWPVWALSIAISLPVILYIVGLFIKPRPTPSDRETA
ncbi:GerAB/ArcD/ProY family transporter [Brevibacillus dissolubilis]|uniref:GerAB/ArcD/ProY family transporter n=1 Tax=Brevibacillus dissolubilis TaxID=1844116 RepID=UPI0011174832|nr:GerAB/ArcD/ProY family transporter [Brevibacillus dissolubilis]